MIITAREVLGEALDDPNTKLYAEIRVYPHGGRKQPASVFNGPTEGDFEIKQHSWRNVIRAAEDYIVKNWMSRACNTSDNGCFAAVAFYGNIETELLEHCAKILKNMIQSDYPNANVHIVVANM